MSGNEGGQKEGQMLTVKGVNMQEMLTVASKYGWKEVGQEGKVDDQWVKSIEAMLAFWEGMEVLEGREGTGRMNVHVKEGKTRRNDIWKEKQDGQVVRMDEQKGG